MRDLSVRTSSTVLKRRLVFLAKLVLGLGLLTALLVSNENWKQLLNLASGAQLAYLPSFFGISVVLIWVSCLKWKLFVTAGSNPPSILRLMGLYIIGYLFNNLLPSNVGGDAMRSYMLGKRVKSQAHALSTVFMERITGFIAMVMLAVGAFLVLPNLRADTLVLWSILIMSAIVGSLILAVVVPVEQLRIWRRFENLWLVATVLRRVESIRANILEWRGKPGVLLRAMLYSYAFYGVAVLNVYLAGLVIGVDLTLGRLFALTPIIMLIAAIPLTPNSIGIWEWSFSTYLVSAGALPEEGLAIALLLRAKTLLISLLGGVLFLMWTDRSSQKAKRTPHFETPASLPAPELGHEHAG